MLDSFMFGTHDMYAEYGIMVIKHDFLMPALRSRKVTIPLRSGVHDFGARYYDERMLTMECDTRRELTRGQMRELAFLLSTKNKIVCGDEPDKYYIGRLYDPSEIIEHGEIVDEFTLAFICEPFAYSTPVQIPIASEISLRPEYIGTAPTPTRITITNVGETEAFGIRIRIRERSNTY